MTRNYKVAVWKDSTSVRPVWNVRSVCRSGTGHNSVRFTFINVPSQQPDGQLQKHHITQT